MKLWIKISLISVPTLIVMGVVGWYSFTSSTPMPLAPTSITENATGKLVDIGDGVRLYVYCSGPVQAKGPTIILDGGLNGTHASWMFIQRKIAPFALTCSYDRAGHGLSDPGPKPRTSQQNAHELNLLLKNAALPGPYVLVGHSLGGIHVRTFAALYPQDVAGIVLVDAMHEDQRLEIGSLPWPKQTFKEDVMEFVQTHFPIWNYLNYRKAYQQQPRKEPYTQEEWDYITALQASYKHYMSIEDEDQAIPQSSSELKTLNKDLGDKQLTVITAGKDPRIFDANKVYDNEEDIAYAKIFTQCQGIRFRLQRDVLKYSTRSEQVIAHNSGHNIPDQEPELIVGVILDMLKKIRE